MTDIGATLREARMRRRIDITEVESATKIRAKYLRAMEDEEWSVLPGPTYVRSFLRHFDLDPVRRRLAEVAEARKQDRNVRPEEVEAIDALVAAEAAEAPGSAGSGGAR